LRSSWAKHCYQMMNAIKTSQYSFNFPARKNYRKLFRRLRSLDMVYVGKVFLEHVAVKKEESAKRDRLRRC